MSYFATPYTIHFDDTMAYGSHHFLTGFKFQCAARETLLYGDLIFDQPGVPEALETIHLFTADAYSRNLHPTFLGDRIAILITLEEWGRVSTRFCYRVLGQNGQPICAGFQSMIVADAKTGKPTPLPEPLRIAFDKWRQITEPEIDGQLFRDRILKSTDATIKLFTPEIRNAAIDFLSDRYPVPRVILPGASDDVSASQDASTNSATTSYVRQPEEKFTTSPAPNVLEADVTPARTQEVETAKPETWVFSGQGAFNAALLSQRINQAMQLDAGLRHQLDMAANTAGALISCDTVGLFSGSAAAAEQAVAEAPDLSQLAIHAQGVLGALIRRQYVQPSILLGHSFGELAALQVSGCYDFETGIRIVCERVRAIREHAPPGGGLLAVMSNRQIIREEIAILKLTELVIAGRNHNQQTVVSGPVSDLEQFKNHLSTLGISSVRPASPTSFHHPALKNAAVAWYRELKKLPMRAPQLAVYSPIGRRVISPTDDLAMVLSGQFVKPFDLQGAIEDLHSIGCENFVDCGSSGATGRLIAAAGPALIKVYQAETFAVQTDGPVGDVAGVGVSGNDLQPSSFSQSPPSKASAVQVPAATPVAPDQSFYSVPNFETPTRPRPPIAIVAQGCILPAGSTSPEKLYEAIQQGRSGIHDKRKLDAFWEQDFYSNKLVADRSTSGLVGLVNDEDIAAPDGVDLGVFESFTRAQKLLAIALAPCVSALQGAERVLCLMGTTADGFEDQDGFAVMRYAGIDERQPQVGHRLGNPQSAQQDPYAAVRQVFDQMVRPGLDLMLVDAACASSLYAVSLGMQALESGEADIVLAGGMFCPGPGNNVLFSQFGGLTATGCRPFDANADGVVFSEGAAIVVLQRESDAVAHNRERLAIVRGAGLSSDGRSPSANVPQTSGQLHALRRCYKNYAISPESVSAIEAHGTSTPAGDSTEVRTLSEFFAPYAKQSLPIHSLKGLIGHSGWAAGTASMIAATQMLKTSSFPAQATHAEDSSAVTDTNGVLKVLTSPQQLPDKQARIAIDGFGFGGSNAHVVLESATQEIPRDIETTTSDDELVVVGLHRSMPSIESNGRMIFDRQALKSLEGIIILPDLNDDMDVTQSLALDVVGRAIQSVEGFSDALREETGVVLALCGKTERAVEATSRVLAPRLGRALNGLPVARQLDSAIERARSSGPYTLQCMMPNVSAGRAALQFNLNGPNFVVDAGNESLDAAFRAGKMLLENGSESGTRIAIISAMHANRWPVPGTDSGSCRDEYAVAFVVTTRSFAQAQKLNVVGGLKSVRDAVAAKAGNTRQKIDAAFEALDSQKKASGHAPIASEVTSANSSKASDSIFTIHNPVWVQAPLESLPGPSPQRNRGHENWIVVAPAVRELVLSLEAELRRECNEFRLFLIGDEAFSLAASLGEHVTAVDTTSEESIAGCMGDLLAVNPDLLLAVDNGHDGSEFEATLERAAANRVGEVYFVALKRLATRLNSGKTDAFATIASGWQDSIHPATGAFSGVFKSLRREMPNCRLCVIATRSNAISDVLSAVSIERANSPNTDIDVVYDGATRLVRRLQVNELSQTESSDQPVELNENSVVVISGGARGVTALMAEALLEDFGCHVVALGRSPLEKGPKNFESNEAQREYYSSYLAENADANPLQMRKSFESARARWEAEATISRLANRYQKIEYISVDVTDADTVQDAIAEVFQRFGRVDLVVHGAGVQWSKKIEDRTLDEFRKTFDVKVNGLRNLVLSCRAVTGKVPAAHILTSAYSIYGNDGQHDYGAANETMDRLCVHSNLSNGSRWTSIAWSAWDGIGMTRGSEYKSLAESRNLGLMTGPEGQHFFRQVIKGVTGATINVPISETERTEYGIKTVPAVNFSYGRLLEQPVPLAELECLPFHKARGIMTLPGAWTVDFMINAASQLLDAPARYFAVENMRFLRFVRADQANANLRVVVAGQQGKFTAWLIGNVVNPAGITLLGEVVFARASLSVVDEIRTSEFDGSIQNGSSPRQVVTDPYCAGDPNVDLSGPFDCLSEIEIGPQGRQAVFAPRENGWSGVVPSMLLDASLRVAGMHAVPGALHVPTVIERVVLPVGVSTDSYFAAGWRIRTCAPQVNGDNILSQRIEAIDQRGNVRLSIDGALVTRIK